MDTDVIHDPSADCTCESGDDDICEYRMLADAVIEKLDPRDGDEAEVALCIAAVERVAAYVQSLPCTCADEPCGRCAAIGQWMGRPR